MTTSIKEMREWLEDEIADDMAWIQNNKNLKLTGTERREKRLVMYKAILAALEEKKRPKWDMEKSVDQILHSKAALADGFAESEPVVGAGEERK